jgi:catechol 2,3-dioxygenase-like lactoylglutathione lyase family enzyme
MTVPGIRGMHHAGVVVPDIDEAISFFVDVLGCTLVHVLPAVSGEGNWMLRHLGVHPAAVLEVIAFLRCGAGSNIELFQYRAPDQRTSLPNNADVGATHICFEVADIDRAVAALRRQGVAVQGDPKRVDDGPRAGVSWVYFRAPWGLQLELISGEPVHGDPMPLWSPSRPEK